MRHLPLTRDLVLIGGGHTHALVLRMWGMNPLPGVRVTVINPGPTAPYSGMLPGFVAGHYTREELDIDLVKLARFAGARLVNGAAHQIDRKAQTVTVQGRPMIGYDVLSIDIGITSAMPDVPGFTDHAVPAKPLGTFAARWETFLQTAINPELAIIGGGVAGAELALAMSYALRGSDAHLRLFDRGRVLATLGYTARKMMLAALHNAGIEIYEDTEISSVFPEGIVLKDGRSIRSDFTTGAAGARGHSWVSTIGVEMYDGFISVDDKLLSSDPQIFAVGDCANFTSSPRPKAGVFAVRQAPVLLHNLRAALSGGRLKSFRPQRDYLKLISLGDRSALAEKFGTARSGAILWRIKDSIDRKFMRQFDELPQMEAVKVPRTAALGIAEALGEKPMCGGCGAKVGRAVLSDVLAENFGDDAALIASGQVISSDHLRAFTNDPVVMARIAAVHALGDIWAMGAQPQAATMSLTLPRMSAGLQQRSLAEIMQAATDVVSKAGARIVGGHSSLGDELTIGFTVTGLTDAPVTLAGARAGDALILTKPLGSGTILAAEMAGKAKGADVFRCLDHMMHAQAAAADLLRQAHAMTDITGFGLAGHLRGICDASGTGATLRISQIPVMDGARALSDAGIRSSLFNDNVAGAGRINGPQFDLLFDPQTAGGLLAAVPMQNADSLLSALQSAGYPASIIGQITEGSDIKTQ